MAITITSEPSTSVPNHGYRPLIYRMTSDNANIRKIKCVTYVNSSIVNTVIHDPEFYSGVFVSNQFSFDTSKFIQPSFSMAALPTTQLSLVSISDRTTEIVNTQSRFYEMYLSGGLLLESTVNYNSSTAPVLNNTWHPEQTYSTLNNEYFSDGSKLFLTDYPYSNGRKKVYENERITFSFITATATVKGVVAQYTRDGTLISTTTTGGTAISYYSGTIIVDTQYLSSTCAYFLVVLYDNANNPISQIYRCDVARGYNGTERTVWWKNALGAWDWFYFSGTGEEGLEVDSDKFQAQLSETYTGQERGLQELENYTFETGVLWSPPLTIEMSRYLSKIKYSSDVRIYNRDKNKYYPIVLTNKNDLTINLEGWGQFVKLEYKKSVQINSHRG